MSGLKSPILVNYSGSNGCVYGVIKYPNDKVMVLRANAATMCGIS